MLTSSPAYPRYRADIDGLRAVAVLLVLLFHGHVPGFRAGFIGVDIFFVVSSYLVSDIVLRELGEGRFSFVAFYERRARRILPAFLAMAVVSSILACGTLYQAELVTFGRSLVAATLSGANLFFRRHTNYFYAGETFPLLHTWSLGIEEQFYLSFPLLAWWIHRHRPGAMKGVVVFLALLSLAGSSWVVFTDPGSAFFLPHLRAWELLLGAVPALFPSMDLGERARLRLAWLGAGLIVVSGGVLHRLPFPGIAALGPCVGTLLLLVSGQGQRTRVHDVLAWEPLKSIGLMSYSLYLWHWPLLVFTRLNAVFPSPWMNDVVSLLLAVPVAWLSWRYVEIPVRFGNSRPGRRALFYGVVSATVVMVSLGGGLGSSKILPLGRTKEDPAISQFLAYDGKAHMREDVCFISSKSESQVVDFNACATPVRDRRNVLLLGDSHAAHLWYGLSRAEPSWNVLQVTGGGCRPYYRQRLNAKQHCIENITRGMELARSDDSIDTVVLAARWSRKTVSYVGETIALLTQSGRHVVVVGPLPDYELPLPRLMLLAAERNDSRLVDRYRRVQAETLDADLRRVAETNGATYVSFVGALCGENHCRFQTEAGVPLLFDTDHTTPEGSVELGRIVASSFSDRPRPTRQMATSPR